VPGEEGELLGAVVVEVVADVDVEVAATLQRDRPVLAGELNGIADQADEARWPAPSRALGVASDPLLLDLPDQVVGGAITVEHRVGQRIHDPA
jgi:hypothetical protein